jgi:hypothetical protein
MSKLLSADEILDVNDVEYVDVEVPEWKGTVRLQTMSADDAIKFTDLMSAPDKRKSAMVRIVALCAVNEAGERLFPDGPEQQGKMERLRKKNVKAFMRLQIEALRLNGFADDAKKVEAAAKND